MPPTKGIQIEAFNEPPNLRSQSEIATQAQDHWGPTEIAAVKRKFHADTVRFHVSQPGLDPQSKIYDDAYVPELVAAIKQARAADLVVIVSLDAQGEMGSKDYPACRIRVRCGLGGRSRHPWSMTMASCWMPSKNRARLPARPTNPNGHRGLSPS